MRAAFVLAIGLALTTVGACAPAARMTMPKSEGVAIGSIKLSLSNVHVVVGAHPMLVDTGTHGDLDDLDRGLVRLGIDWHDIKCAVVTHVHADHAGLARALQGRGILIIAGRGDLSRAQRGDHGALHATGWKGVLLKPLIPSDFLPFTPNVLVDDELDLRELCGVDGVAIAAPGHTAGSLVVLVGGGRIALVGDSVSRLADLPVRAGRALLPGRPRRGARADPRAPRARRRVVHARPRRAGAPRRRREGVRDMSFEVTFLGHQGWFVRGDDTAILVDPLLCEDFGAAHALGYRVWPPRAWDLAAMPAIDAVVLSHEHDDHFDIPSLAKLDRAIPIYLSARSSPAARGILATMGFGDVRPLVPGARVELGALELLPFAGDHVNVNCGEEWDTLPLIARHRGGAGSLFTMVDITITPQHVEWARAAVSRPGLVTWTNNSLDWSHMTDWLAVRTDATQQAFVKMGTGHKLIASAWGTPAAMLTCAGGFSFAGGADREWLDAHAFCVDMEAVCKAMLGVYRKEKFVAARPGNTFAMKANRLDRVDERAPWLGAVDAAAWPSRAKVAGDPRVSARSRTTRRRPGGAR